MFRPSESPRRYTLSIHEAEGQAKLLSTAAPGPMSWINPTIHKAPGLAARDRIDAREIRDVFVRGR